MCTLPTSARPTSHPIGITAALLGHDCATDHIFAGHAQHGYHGPSVYIMPVLAMVRFTILMHSVSKDALTAALRQDSSLAST